MSKKFTYSLPPKLTVYGNTEEATEIDLNSSDDFPIVCNSDSLEILLASLDFIKNNPEEMNLVAHVLDFLRRIREYNYVNLRCRMLRESILNGNYGEIVSHFFSRTTYEPEQQRILLYLFNQSQGNKRMNDFETILTEIFPDGVRFYFDEYKQTLFVSFVAEETVERRELYEVCQYLFADILMNICVRWNTLPMIIGRWDCMVVAEGEQRCGTLL